MLFLLNPKSMAESLSTGHTVALDLKDIVPEWLFSLPSSSGLRQLPHKIMENSVILLE